MIVFALKQVITVEVMEGIRRGDITRWLIGLPSTHVLYVWINHSKVFRSGSAATTALHVEANMGLTLQAKDMSHIIHITRVNLFYYKNPLFT